MPDLPPILTSHLFPLLEARLIELLESLTPEDWSRRALPKWTVKDVAAHLLDGNLRRLSIGRDGYWGESFQGSSYTELVEFLNGLNADWVRAARRLSPRVLIDLLRLTGEQVSALVSNLDPHAPAVFPVAWAGEEQSANWFDIAREYTEKWHHQQQIREAVGRPGIMGRELYFPVLDTFMRALPVAYRNVTGEANTSLEIHVSGEAGGSWFLCHTDDRWRLSSSATGQVSTRVEIPQEIAWRIFTKGIDADTARAQVQITGIRELAEPLLAARAVMV